MFFFNSSVYSLWYKEKVNSNQVGIFKQTGDEVVSGIVNNGTQGQEPINHPAPLAHPRVSNGHIYVYQNKFHVDSVRVYRTNVAGDVTAGFELLGEIGTDTSYLVLIEKNGSDVVIQTRSGAENKDNYSQSVIK